jgi:hypothetical protein
MTLSERINRNRERLVTAIVWRLPKTIVYWAAIRLGAHATTGKYGSQNVPELHFMDALKRWEGR